MWFIPPNPEDPQVQAAMERAIAKLTPEEKKLVSEAFQIFTATSWQTHESPPSEASWH